MAPNNDKAWSRRAKYSLNVFALVLSLVIVLVAINWWAVGSGVRIDLTASRAWTLSPQTIAVLEALEGPCLLTLIFAEDEQNMTEIELRAVRGARRQVEDVLREFQNQTSLLTVAKIDPSKVSSMGALDTLLDDLQQTEAETIEQYRNAILEGGQLQDSLRIFLKDELQILIDDQSHLAPSHPVAAQLREIHQVLSTFGPQIETLSTQTTKMLETGSQRYLPDWLGAASVVAASLRDPADSLRIVSNFMKDTAANVTDLPAPLPDHFITAADRFQKVADQLSNVQDQLQDLPELKLSRIMRDLTRDNCIVLMDETEATTIPFEALFPSPSAREMESGQRIDRRFAGEQVVSSAIRRLVIKEQPAVVIVHAESDANIFAGSPGKPDAAFVADRLAGLGFEVMSWDVTVDKKPTLEMRSGAHPVWVIMTPEPMRGGTEGAVRAAKLAEIATSLISAGERVMMNYWPSPMVGFNQPDYWTDVVEPLGVGADTGRVIFESHPQPGSLPVSLHQITLRDYTTSHVIGNAVQDLDTTFIYAVPLLKSILDTGNVLQQSTRVHTILEVKPSASLWADAQWTSPQNIKPPVEVEDEESYPLVLAIERDLPNGTQRCLVVGSGVWFYSDVVSSMRLVSTNYLIEFPGNAELFTAGVCWLAGLDELVLPGAITQASPRIENLTATQLIVYRWLLIIVLPVISLVFGVAVWLNRRN